MEGREAASQYPYTREWGGNFGSRLPETTVPGVSTFDGLRRNRAHARLRDSWLREIGSLPGAETSGIPRSTPIPVGRVTFSDHRSPSARVRSYGTCLEAVLTQRDPRPASPPPT